MRTLEGILQRTKRNGDCLEWQGAFRKGLCMIGNDSVQRLVFILTRGRVSASTKVYHTCNNKRCINIKHLDIKNGRITEPAIKVKKINGLPTGLTYEGFGEGQPIDMNRVNELRQLLPSYFTKTKTINYARSSYNIKHVLERLTGKYIANGELIAAFILEGYNYQAPNINAHFNVSQKSYAFLKP